VDISSPAFDPTPYGRSYETLMARIHGVLPDGRLVEGVEVFRRAYAAVGRGWWLGWTRLPGLRMLADAGYRWFARNRLRWTGREEACPGETCAVEPATERAAEGRATTGGRAPG